MVLIDRNVNALFYARKKLEFIFSTLEGYEFGVGGGSVLKHIYYYIHGEGMKGDSLEDLSKMPDIDVFARSTEEAMEIADKFQNEGFRFLEENYVSKNRKYFYEGNRIDLIFPQGYLGTPEKIVKYFDMAQCAFMVTEDKGYHLEDAFEAVEKKQMLLNFINNQSFNDKRIDKYIHRGFEVNHKDEIFLDRIKNEDGFRYMSRAGYGNPPDEPNGVFPNGGKEVFVEEFDEELIENLREKRCEFTRNLSIIG